MLLTVVMREGKRKFQFSEKNFITVFLAREGVAVTPKPFPTGKKKKSTCSLTAVLIFRSYPQEAGNLWGGHWGLRQRKKTAGQSLS